MVMAMVYSDGEEVGGDERVDEVRGMVKEEEEEDEEGEGEQGGRERMRDGVMVNE